MTISSAPPFPRLSMATITNASWLNVRAGLGTNYVIVTTIAAETNVTVLTVGASSNDWCKIKLSDESLGYVEKSYLKMITATSVPEAPKNVRVSVGWGLLRKSVGTLFTVQRNIKLM